MEIVKWLGLGLVALIGLTLASNAALPSASPAVRTLDETQTALLRETFHLRASLGNAVWPGWGDVHIPLLVYNERYAFLTGYAADSPRSEGPPAGWTVVPWDRQAGGAWERMDDGDVAAAPVYRLELPADGPTPQAFTVRVGNAWVASLPTHAWMRISFVRELREQVPAPLSALLPYRPIVDAFVGGPKRHVFALLHEVFHAFQGMRTPKRLADAERVTRWADQYPWEDPNQERIWDAEVNALADALTADADEAAVASVREFLAHRAERRAAFAERSELIAYEQQREWLEGLAKYAELASWRTAANDPGYSIPSERREDLGFVSYAGFEGRWSSELSTLRYQAHSTSDSRWYYSGMAQAFLLDRLRPDWKREILDEGVFLEDLLRAAVDGMAQAPPR